MSIALPPSLTMIEKYSPITGELLYAYPCADEQEVREACHLARDAQSAWAKVSLKKRAQALKNFCDMLYAQADAIAELIHQEVGKPIHDALETDIAAALSIVRYTARMGAKRLEPRWIPPDRLSLLLGRLHWETWHPRGVIGVIAPWNYPIAIPAGGIAAALMAGNAVVFKPSEHAPACGEALAYLLRQTLQESGYSPELLQIVQGEAQTGQSLVNADIDGLIFTGSVPVGQLLRIQTAEKGIWSSMELGGNDAMLVLEGTDPDWASSCAIWGRFQNAGQACAAIKHLYIPKGMAEDMLSRLQNKVAQLRVGPSRATIGHSPSACHLGPLISDTQREKLHAQVRDALSKGATLIYGGQRLTGPGYFYMPTLLGNLPAKARLLKEETFGPVLSIFIYEQVEEAVRQINMSRHGLTASILGPPDLAAVWADYLECGTVVINELGLSNFALASAPWGGWKDSGHGVSHGERALTDLCRQRIVSESYLCRLPLFRKPFWQFSRDERLAPGIRAQALLSLSNARWPGFRGLKALWEHRSQSKL
jgi:acyl-CoA reductase-like NAD-dependent aldehyde dehydrogenase